MIEEVFISDLSNNLLFGHSHSFPFKSPAPMQGGPHCPLTYPASVHSGRRYSHLRVNDAVLTVRFTDLDSFSATRYLVDLKLYLEDKISKITAESVRSNYFALLELLKTPEIAFGAIHGGAKVFNENARISNSVFVDIVQNIHCVQSVGGGVLRSRTYGEVFLDRTPVSSLKMVLHVPDGVEFKTPYPFEQQRAGNSPGSVVVVSGRSIENRNVLSFQIGSSPISYFKLEAGGSESRRGGRESVHTCTFTSEYKGRFKLVEFRIPVGGRAYKTEVRASGGEHEFDMKTGTVHWRFKDCLFGRESIKIAVLELDEEVADGPGTGSISVDFKLEDTEDSPVRLVSCTNALEPGQKFWMRCTTQSQSYVFVQRN